jgi:hypothetical protein
MDGLTSVVYAASLTSFGHACMLRLRKPMVRLALAVMSSNARLFADECLLYHVVNSNADQLQLQEDLHQLEKWEKTWQMSFNADKCFTLMDGLTSVVYAASLTSFGHACMLRLRKPMVRLALAVMLLM